MHQTCLHSVRLSAMLFSLCLTSVTAWSQIPAWQQCTALPDQQRLACFDQWAQQQALAQSQPSATASAATASHTAASARLWDGSAAATGQVVPVQQHTPDVPVSQMPFAANGGCRDPRYSEVSRFFELEPGTDCGNFSLRGYRPISVSVVTADRINSQPQSPDQGRSPAQSYQKQELRIQLSLRTKIASGLLTPTGSDRLDSLWVGYSQQSYWQLFNSEISSPFRNTDHEPEIFYIYPTDAALPWGWRWRYSGIGLVHQSNGQSNPLSRTWDRWYLMTGAELGNRWHVQAKIWRRIPERGDFDDNRDIERNIGRGEIKLGWNINDQHSLGLQLRGSLTKGRGSAQLEWMRTLGQGFTGGKSNLRLYARLFSGYGESIIDYNFKRTSLAVGLSLLDF